MASLPRFTIDGLLPAGDFVLSIDELSASPLVVGWPDADHWDSVWRMKLVTNLSMKVADLWRVGIREVYIDGSFVEDKPHPNDIDGYFICERDFLLSGELEARLREFDSVWTWSKRYSTETSPKRQLPMWHKYRIELFPHVGQLTGIVDQFGHELEFPSAFRQSRDFKPKGIVKLRGAE